MPMVDYSAMSLISQMPLVPGRDCGTCYTALTVNDGGLFKPQGTRCPNLTGNGLCGTDRVIARLLLWLRPPELGQGHAASRPIRRPGRHLTEQALDAPSLLETVAAAVAIDRPLDLIIPGHTSG